MNTKTQLTIKMPENKGEEIALFNKLVSFFENSDTYLAEFFNKELSGWLENQIRSDFPANIYENLQYAEQEAEHANYRLSEAQAEITNLKDQLGEERRRYTKLNENFETLVKVNTNTSYENDKLVQENEHLRLQIRRMELEKELEEINKKLNR